MSPPPAQLKIFHITHVDNLSSIVRDGHILPDSVMTSRGGPGAAIGMSSIKQRRLGLPLKCHPGDCVGEYVPFYFCPRSIMLFVIHCANHSELTYCGGQGPIVHLQSDLHSVVAWATGQARRWAFTTANAGAYYAPFHASVAQLNLLEWVSIGQPDFRDPTVKEAKQSEFLVHGGFPWQLVKRVGVKSPSVQTAATAAIAGASHQPPIDVRPDWYY